MLEVNTGCLIDQHGATGPINDLLVHGNITSSNLVGLLKGKHILDLAKDMLDGNIFAGLYYQIFARDDRKNKSVGINICPTS